MLKVRLHRAPTETKSFLLLVVSETQRILCTHITSIPADCNKIQKYNQLNEKKKKQNEK